LKKRQKILLLYGLKNQPTGGSVPPQDSFFSGQFKFFRNADGLISAIAEEVDTAGWTSGRHDIILA
jgi:hypothetical protein